MKKLLLLALIATSLAAQTEQEQLRQLGTAVAEGFRYGDSSAFREFGHPDLIRKIRQLMTARIGHDFSFAPPSVTTPEAVASLSDAEVMDAFVGFIAKLNAFIPEISAEWTFPYTEVSIEGDHASVHVSERLVGKDKRSGEKFDRTTVREIEFEKIEGKWLYLAGPATNIHLDLPLGIHD